MTRFQLSAGVRILGIFTVSLTVANPLFAGQNSPLEVYRVRPQTVGVGSAVIKLIRPQGTPLLYDVALDATQVETTFPEVMEPRLVRPDVSKLSRLFRSSQGLIKSLKHSLRRVKEETGIVDAAGLADLFRESSSHTYTITGHTLTFANTGPAPGVDFLSKHVLISEDLHDVRFAGQMWKQGELLCVNGNSGTYVKKRGASGLNKAPKLQTVVAFLTPLFSPALKVTECRAIAPSFGSSESLDQAQKAEIAVQKAQQYLESEAELSSVLSSEIQAELKTAMETTTLAAALAFAASENAHLTHRERLADPDAYLELDRLAADAADAAKEARKKIEKLLPGTEE